MQLLMNILEARPQGMVMEFWSQTACVWVLGCFEDNVSKWLEQYLATVKA